MSQTLQTSSTDAVSAADPVLDLEMAERLAEIFAALGDPSRLRIISALAHRERSVGDLSRLVGMTLLRTQRIVRARKVGRQVFYFLDDDHIHDLLDRGIAHVQHK